jgi:hypothetical protein
MSPLVELPRIEIICLLHIVIRLTSPSCYLARTRETIPEVCLPDSSSPEVIRANRSLRFRRFSLRAGRPL